MIFDICHFELALFLFLLTVEEEYIWDVQYYWKLLAGEYHFYCKRTEEIVTTKKFRKYRAKFFVILLLSEISEN